MIPSTTGGGVITKIWISTTFMTVLVGVNESEVIFIGPPIIRRFIGQNIRNLLDWAGKQPGFRYHIYS